MSEPPEIDLHALADELAATAARRRADGTYPPGIDDDLRREFETRLHHIAAQLPSSSLRAAQHQAQLAGQFELRPYQGSNPAKAALSKGVDKAIGYALVDVLGQMNAYRAALDRLFDAMIDVLEPRASAMEQELLDLRARVAELEDAESGVSTPALGKRLDDLQRRVDRRGFAPWFDGSRFEEAFRGDADDYEQRYASVVHRMADASPVLDVGCGRGEILSMLRHQGVEARGVDLDREGVAHARQLGLEAAEADAIEYLAALPDESLGGVVCIQVIEHLGPQGVLDFVQLCARKVRPGGEVFVETVNPRSLYIFANALYVDPTHTQPIHPSYLEFLFREAGFDARVELRSPVDDDRKLQHVDDDSALGEAHNQLVGTLNELLFGHQDYAVIAVR